jgi:hypothetical protein
MVGARVRSSGLCVQGPCQSRSAAGVLEVLEMARVCRRGLVGFGICNIHRTCAPAGIVSPGTQSCANNKGSLKKEGG